MDDNKSLTILQALADGANPFTGEGFPGDSVYQDPRLIRALFAAVQSLEQAAGRRSTRKDLPPNTGKKWAQEEEQKLAVGFESGRSIEELAVVHQRTYGSIEARLAKIGKIELPPEKLRFHQARKSQNP